MSLKIYLVEDSPTIRDNLSETLAELAGTVTVGVADGETQGAEWLLDARNEWELVVVDLFLREGNGLSLLHSLRNRHASQKVVVLSNYATPDIRSRCLALSADAVFDKSTDIEALVEFCLAWQRRDSGSAALS